jgi:SAM-dependent methyltransferase
MESNRPDEIFFDPDIYESQFAYAAQFSDIPFWIRLAQTFGPRVLELACGTGRITLPAFVSGVDFSAPMLAVAQERARARSLPISFILGDIRALSFKGQYDFIFLPTGTISHLIARSDVEAFLAGARRALRPKGVLALDVHNPFKTFLKSWPLDPGPEHSSFEHRATGKTVLVETTQAYSADTQILTVKFRYTFPDNVTKDATIVLKLYFSAELQSLLHYNGFEVLSIYGDYTQTAFTSESTKYVVAARKRAVP